MTMDVFFEVKLIVRILHILLLFAIFHVEADKLECIKHDECSCRINAGTPQEISLWPMPSHNGVEDSAMRWLYDINLCHGVNKNTDAPQGGCVNATVCQYLVSNKDETFEVGQFGNVTFGQYDIETKSISLLYYGRPQENTRRFITVNLRCDENGNVNQADYNEVTISLFNPIKFKITITSKAACLRPLAPKTPSTLASTSPSTIPSTLASTSPSTLASTSPSTLKSTSPSTLLSTLASTSPSTSPSTSLSTLASTSPRTLATTSPNTTPGTSPSTIPSTTPNTSLGSSTPSRNLSTSSKSTPRTSASSVTSGGKLKTVYIVLIVIAGFVPVIAIGFYVAYKIFRKRRRGDDRLLIEDEDSEGTAHMLDPCLQPLSVPV